MKVLEIRCKNLNSLYGSWRIDFTAPEYADGIFAVTGPTGAGKSTILDALCLALYGRTPRLSMISKSTNEIMSRRRGECSAEVTFQTSEGTYTSRWSQHRARRNPDGALAETRQEVFETHTGTVLETRKREIEGLIDKLTGMNFERFTRSMLLAQGSFAVFLQSPPRERAPILEEITGTEIYSLISEKTYERNRQEDQKLAKLTEESEGFTFFSEAQEKDIRRFIAEAASEDEKLRRQVNQLHQQIQWVQHLDQLNREIHALREEQQELTKKLEAFSPYRVLLEQAAAAAEIAGRYTLLEQLRQQLHQDKQNLQSLKEEHQKALHSLETAARQQQEALQLLEDARNRLRDEGSVIKQVRSLDVTWDQQRQKLDSLQAQHKELTEELELNLQEQREVQHKQHQHALQAKTHASYLEEHQEDQHLGEKLAGIREQLQSLHRIEIELAEIDRGLEQLNRLLQERKASLTPVQEAYEARKAELDVLKHQREILEGNLKELLAGKSLPVLRQERDRLYAEIRQIREAASYEQQRAYLQEGSPCPLCGSPHHPYASREPEESDETLRRYEAVLQQIAEAEELDEQVKTGSHQERLQMEQLHAASEELGELRKAAEQSEQDIKSRSTARDSLLRQYRELTDRLLQELSPYGVEKLPESGINALIHELEQRHKQWQHTREAKQEIEASMNQLQVKLDLAQERESRIRSRLQPLDEACAQQETQLRSTESQRSSLFGDSDPDQREVMLQQEFSQAEADYQQKRSACEQLQRESHGMEVRIEDLSARLQQMEDELKIRTQQWEAERSEAGFASEEAFLSCRLESSRRKELQNRARELDDAWNDAAWKLEDRVQVLAEQQKRGLTDKSAEKLEEQQRQVYQQLQELSERMGAMKQQLADSSQAKQQHQQKLQAIEAQREICGKWNTLTAMIGSADGKKYRNFAQGLTFEMLISQANSQLSRMTDRYLLIQDTEEPLELNVIDNYQGGEIRTTKNLSGGESFIVSLALALGLSRISSRRVRVDSLFLDEGFGTLDEDTLDTALETLGGLHHEGKLIGIISHVTVLQERISTQIRVVPVSEGMSILKGPGCSRGA